MYFDELMLYRLLNSHNGEVVELKRNIEENANRNFALIETEILNDQRIQYTFKVEVDFVLNQVNDLCQKNGISFVVM